MKSTASFSEVFQDEEWGPSYASNQTAFNKYSGYPDTLFKYFEEVDFFFLILFTECLNNLRQPLGEPNLEHALVWEW